MIRSETVACYSDFDAAGTQQSDMDVMKKNHMESVADIYIYELDKSGYA